MRNEYELLNFLNDSCNKQRALVRFKLKGGRREISRAISLNKC